MPRYYPNTRFSDCWSSVGDITFYHRNGICYFRSKAHGEFPGTGEQLVNLDLHRRAIAAWRSLDHKTQEVWGTLAENVEAHRPPYNDGNHISGYNLFVSAYHGHAQLGNEHTPEPHPFEPFPVFSVDFVEGMEEDAESMRLSFRLSLCGTHDYMRYRVLFKVQIVRPGEGKHPGKMRNYLSHDIPVAEQSNVSIVVPKNESSMDEESQMFGIHARYLLLDTVTGYRSQYHSLSTIFQPVKNAK